MKFVFRLLYSLIPFKQPVYRFIKHFGVPPHAIFQHLHFHGVIDVKINDQQHFKMMHYGHALENELFWQGLYKGWEKNSMAIWMKLSAESKVIFDIGANTGLYSLVSKAINRQAEVHAFEPFRPIYQKFVENVNMNEYNVRANCLAVSNYTGTGVIYSEDENFAYSVTVNQNLWAKDKEAFKIPIETITLKEYIEKAKLQQIDLMKIDVETHEPEVMEGFAEYFLKFKPVLLIEILNNEVAEKLNPYFDATAFDFYNIDEKAGIKKVTRLTKSDFYNFLIVPKEKAHLYNEKSFL